MKLEFAYFDFTFGGKYMTGWRGLGVCALNFSTTYDFTVVHDMNDDAYVISAKEKPIEQCVPKDFWGTNIYNITALVGDNGAGKSSIIQQLILRLLVKQGEYGKININEFRSIVPFCLVVSNIENNGSRFSAFCSDIGNFKYDNTSGSNINCSIISDDYSEHLLKLKLMLIDNTISHASIDFDDYVERVCNTRINDDSLGKNGRAFEHNKQLFNKSLSASIRSSCMMSYNNQQVYQTAEEYLSTYLRYESYQEARVIFAQEMYEILSELLESGVPVPIPSEVTISVDNPAYRLAFMGINGLEGLADLVQRLQNHGLAGILISNTLINMAQTEFAYKLQALIEYINSKSVHKYSIIEIVGSFIKNEWSNDANSFSSLIDFIIDNTVFFNSSINVGGATQSEFCIRFDAKEVFNDNKKRCLFTEFIDKYRAVSNIHYFLVFSFGLSSGEKNMLKMFTQFRYLIHGKPFSSAPNEPSEIRNEFYDSAENSLRVTQCDTLFLFLDEADLTYHPEWQRKFVGVLSAALSKMFGNFVKVKDIQVFLATHSPLMLSDFPDASTIYLKKGSDGLVACDAEKHKSTFAQNLYYILRDGFFMEDSIGEFAKRKINNTAKWCFDIVEREYEYHKKVKNQHECAQNNYYAAMKKYEDLVNGKKSNGTSSDFDESNNLNSDSAIKLSNAEKSCNTAKKRLYGAFVAYDAYLKAKHEQLLNQSDEAFKLEIKRELDTLIAKHETIGKKHMTSRERIDSQEHYEESKRILEENRNYFIKKRKGLQAAIEIARLLPEGIIRGKLISDIEQCERILSRYGILLDAHESLEIRKSALERKKLEIEQELGMIIKQLSTEN